MLHDNFLREEENKRQGTRDAAYASSMASVANPVTTRLAASDLVRGIVGTLLNLEANPIRNANHLHVGNLGYHESLRDLCISIIDRSAATLMGFV